MIDSNFRSLPQKYIFNPLAILLAHANIKPGHITFTALLTGLFSTLLISLGYIWLPSLLLLISGLLDILDGSVARITNTSSPVGSVSDILSDRLIEFAICMSLFLYDPSRGLLTMLMLGSILMCVSSFLVVGIFTINTSHKSFHYSPGLMERTEAFIFFIAMIVLPQYFTLLAILFVILVSYTALRRFCEFSYGVLHG